VEGLEQPDQRKDSRPDLEPGRTDSAAPVVPAGLGDDRRAEPPASGLGRGGSATVEGAPVTAEWQFNDIHGYTEPDGARLIHRLAGAELFVRGGRLVRGAGYETAPRPTRRELARAGAILRLRQRHRYHIHAAGVVDPAGRAWLFTGQTGSGKSTLAYALARQGWPILGDDGVIVEVASVGVVAHRWREPLRVSMTLSDAFPELAEASGATRMLPGDPRQRAEVQVEGARSAPVAALIWVEQGATDGITPLTPADALIELVRQSAWVLIADGGSPAHLAALRQIAVHVPSFRLVHSPAQLHRIHETLAAALP
jgi:hypothetical protein